MPYIGNQPGTGTRNRFIYTATASQTTFTGADDNGKTLKYADSDYVDVYLNGICLVPVTDYTSTSKTSIVLTQAASLNDTLEVVAYDIATISDTVSKADGGTFEDGVTIRTADNTAQLTLESTDADASVGPLFKMKRSSGSAADNDAIGEVTFNFNNDAEQETIGTRMRNFIIDASDGTEDAAFDIFSMKGGSLQSIINYDSNTLVFNDSSQDIDFRVESDDNANTIFVDASEPSVAFGLGTGDSTVAKMSVGLTGAVTAGDTDGATIGKGSIFRLVDDTNWSSTDSTIFLMGGGTGGAIGQISSAIGFARESNTTWGTQLKFYTHPPATSDLDDLDERMRIDGSGNVMIGATSSNYPSVTGVTISPVSLTVSRDSGSPMDLNRGQNDGQIIGFRRSSTTVGSISVSSSATAFNTSSDYRLKENVETLSGAITRVKSLKPKRFSWIVDEEDSANVDGFLAHEAQTVVPEAVTGTHNETEAIGNITDGDGNTVKTGVTEPDTLDEGHTWTATGTQPVYQGIDQAKLVPLLTAALQEAIAKIETLETKVAALEAG